MDSTDVQLSNETDDVRRKTFVIDTNVFLHDPMAMYAFDDNNIAIPMIVLEEIDSKKDRMDEVGSNARRTCRILDELREKGSLSEGVEVQKGGKLTVHSVEDFQGMLPDELNDDHPDNMIIAVAVGLRDSSGCDEPVKVVTKDINMRIKCNVIGMECEDYRRYQVATGTDELYTGIVELTMDDDVIEGLRQGERIDIDVEGMELYPNHFIVDEVNDVVARVDPDEDVLLNVARQRSYNWIEPRNVEQECALKILYDDRIKLVSLIGKAGSGKTIISVAAALDLVIEQERYSKLIISRPVQPVGKDLGYLPGTKQEKMDPWVQPIYDNIEQLVGRKGARNDGMFKGWMEKGLIEIEAITYIRGRSISDALIIIDEAQNLTGHELRTIVTRIGEGTKLILTGDIQQIDNQFVDTLSNGLTYAVECFKEYGIAGHITLTQGERSDLASLAATIL